MFAPKGANEKRDLFAYLSPGATGFSLQDGCGLQTPRRGAAYLTWRDTSKLTYEDSARFCSSADGYREQSNSGRCPAPDKQGIFYPAILRSPQIRERKFASPATEGNLRWDSGQILQYYGIVMASGSRRLRAVPSYVSRLRDNEELAQCSCSTKADAPLRESEQGRNRI